MPPHIPGLQTTNGDESPRCRQENAHGSLIRISGSQDSSRRYQNVIEETSCGYFESLGNYLRALRVNAFRNASTKPRMVYSRACASTRNLHSRRVFDVTGPIEANTIPSSDVFPASFTKFRAVDELVKVIAWGRRRR